MRVIWAIVYAALAVMFMLGLYWTAQRIRTHTLPVGSIQLTVPYSKYLVGETVSFTIKNNYNSPVYLLNHCPDEPLEVYRLENGQWVRQHDEASLDDCPDERRQISVPANGLVSGSFAPWRNLFKQPGKYRVVAFVEYYNALPYQDFEVIALPAGTSKTTTTPAEQQTQDSALPTSGSATPYSPKQTKTISISDGTIVVEYDTANIYVTSIAPAQGCTYEGGESGSQVEVTFKCPGGETQVQLSLANGQVAVKIESEND
jgi:hypothetical protein